MATKIEHTAIVPYSSEQMFSLVNNIRAYKEFVPYCHHSEVHAQSDQMIEATLTLSLSIPIPLVGKKNMLQTFRTKNHLTGNTRMDIELIDGPMKHLKGFWLFETLDNGQTKVCLSLEVEFTNRVMAMAFKAVSNQVAMYLMDAFIQRASQMYSQETLTI